MDNYKEYLDPKDGYALVKQNVNMPVNQNWIEIPEGAEIAIKFNVDMDAHGVCFYKNNGKLSYSQKDPSWNESLWSQEDLLNEDFRDGRTDLTHKVLWIRLPQDPALISGAEAKLAWANGESVQFRDEFDKWYEDWTDLNSKKNGFWITDFDLPHHQFRLKPTTLTVNAELPKPAREFQQNTEVYAVTYEFKTREERNAFADKLRGTNL